ncbi:MAG: MATE family efflux transporter [Clostridiales bacterium]|nr:MATE family efflux transporter [Clostridiales bacterium]
MAMFETMSVPQAILKNTIPAMVAVLFNLVYNLADTFFIGLTHDDLKVAAISLGTPLFLILTAMGTVFGMGGTSVISRALGKGDKDYAKKTCSFCMWGGIVGGIILLAIYEIFANPILSVLGASESTWDYAMAYMRIIAIAGPFAVITSAFSNIIRCEGKSMTATLGMLGGNLLNIILDPIFILGFGMGTRGAALATTISMLVAACYYFLYFALGKSMLSASLKDFSMKNKIFSSVMIIGIPSAFGTLMVSVATIIMNARMAAYNDLAVAATGVATKITMFATMLAGGIGQGVQSLIGYCVGAHKWDRLKKLMYFSLAFAFILCLAVSLLCIGFAEPIVNVFLTETESSGYAMQFTREMLITGALVGVFYVAANTLQAMGAAGSALFLNLSRQGIFFIPLMFIFQAIVGMNGIIIAQPIADVVAFVVSVLLLMHSYSSLKKKAGLEGEVA